jgi:hypothetical protein
MLYVNHIYRIKKDILGKNIILGKRNCIKNRVPIIPLLSPLQSKLRILSNEAYYGRTKFDENSFVQLVEELSASFLTCESGRKLKNE